MPGHDASRTAEGGLEPLVRLFRANWRRVTLTYFLFNLESLLNLAQPSVLGLAINGLRLVWALCFGGGMMLVNALFMGALIVSVSMRPRRLVALRKILKRRPFDGSGSV
jgi:hypothetical protein